MKNTILMIFIALLIAFNFTAQCTPGSNFADSTFGAWPDTTTNFPNTILGEFYSTDLNFKVPTDAGDVLPVLAGNTILDFRVDSVVGLNPGLTYSCNTPDCFYLGGSNGCAQISGSTTEIGTSNITIYISANLQSFLGVIPFPYSFSGYHITVEENTADLSSGKLKNTLIYPNPVNDYLIFQSNLIINSLEIYNSDWKLVSIWNDSIVDKINTTELDNGIYFLKLNSISKSDVVKFVKE
jgi:hypothetical protein